jgi:tRNA wybutosine-synthesizing protein 3
MPQDIFAKRKKDVLSKKDKSSKGEWDKKISRLCNKINSSENYYTTSSCSGRIVLMIDSDKKESGLFLKRYHDIISLKQLKKDLNELASKKKKEKIKFKQEPCALNVACRTIEDAKILCNKARIAGWKRIGIMLSDKRVMVSLNSTERLELPVLLKGKILVDDFFLQIIVDESNKKLKKSWEKIKKLENNLN